MNMSINEQVVCALRCHWYRAVISFLKAHNRRFSMRIVLACTGWLSIAHFRHADMSVPSAPRA